MAFQVERTVQSISTNRQSLGDDNKEMGQMRLQNGTLNNTMPKDFGSLGLGLVPGLSFFFFHKHTQFYLRDPQMQNLARARQLIASRDKTQMFVCLRARLDKEHMGLNPMSTNNSYDLDIITISSLSFLICIKGTVILPLSQAMHMYIAQCLTHSNHSLAPSLFILPHFP